MFWSAAACCRFVTSQLAGVKLGSLSEFLRGKLAGGKRQQAGALQSFAHGATFHVITTSCSEPIPLEAKIESSDWFRFRRTITRRRSSSLPRGGRVRISTSLYCWIHAGGDCGLADVHMGISISTHA